MTSAAKAWFEVVNPMPAKALEAACRAKRIRMGPQRCAVARTVAEAEGRFDFDMVWDRARRIAPRISRGTVYLSLRRFRIAGFIRLAASLDRTASSGASPHV